MKESFPHSLNARNSVKMQRLIQTHGMQGVGTYWCIVEMLYEQEGRLLLSDIATIAYILHVKEELVGNVIKGFGLFECDNTAFWSAEAVARAEEERIEAEAKAEAEAEEAAAREAAAAAKSEIYRKNAEKRWAKKKADDANNMQLQCNSNATAMQLDMQLQCNCISENEKERFPLQPL